MSSCPHLAELANVKQPRLVDAVHREECTQCFDNQDGPDGVDVCLTCFNGGCLDATRHHARTHFQRTGHPFTLNVKRRPKPSQRRESEEPPAKMTKLAIVEEREEDKYDHITTVECWKCGVEKGADLPQDAQLQPLIDGIMHSMSSSRQSEVQSWEEEITACEHTLTVQQLPTATPIHPSGLAHCNSCDLKENLWLCLTCGSLGCGRQQYGGTGGNGHGLKHYEETGHVVSVKLGTITPEGSADIFCYACQDTKLDPELQLHLSTFGINVATQTKTEKSMTELQIEQNLKFDFSLTDESGRALEPVFGPGLTGLSNLGNSCYMSSVLQTVFSLPAFQSRYHNNHAAEHALTCPEPFPADCVDCQMLKVADGLLSGRYSHAATHLGPNAPPPSNEEQKKENPLAHDSPTPIFQEGVKPAGFKTLVGKGHAEFATMRQQDAEEFLGHLITVLRRHAQRTPSEEKEEATQVFSFGLEQRLQCMECKRVRYRVDGVDDVSLAVPAREKEVEEDGKKLFEEVRLTEMLDVLCGVEELEYSCPSCGKGVVAQKKTSFATFPKVLVLHAKKFQLVGWVPTKLDIPVVLPPSDTLTLDTYLGHVLQPNEEVLPDTDAPSSSSAGSNIPSFDAGALSQLEGMGFPLVRCQKALLATGNTGDAEAAMEWLFAHMEDPDIDDPIDFGKTSSSSKPEPSAEHVSMLADMGFTSAQAKKALMETGGNAERAVEWLFSHPDDMGEDTTTSAVPSSPSAKPEVAGSKDFPAKYVLKAFISHKGPSVHSGHYVAHIKQGNGDWVLFNDEKVVKADRESVEDLKKLAYLYVFEAI